MKPQLADLAKKHGDKVVVLLVDANRNTPLAMKAGVRSIPDTRLILGGEQLEKVVGGYPMSHFEKLVKKHSKSLSVPVASSSSVSGEGSADGSAIAPMKENWLPPGVTPVE